MSLRVSEIPSLKCLYRELGYGADFRDRYGPLYHSTRRWSETYVDQDGTTGQSMIHWSTVKGNSDLEKLSQKFLEENHGIGLWPQTSGGGLEYPKDQKRLVALLKQLFWKQNIHIDKADRVRAYKQQQQRDQTREGIPFIRANTHATGSSMAQGQSCYEDSLVSGDISKDYSPRSRADSTCPDMYARARLNAGNDHVHATQLYANGRGKRVLDAQKPVTLEDQQESPLKLQNDTASLALPPTPSRQVRTGADVFDFVGSDDERQVHGHRKGLVLTFRFTLNIRQYQNCMASYAGRPAPTAIMKSLPTPPVAMSNEMLRRHTISPDHSWTVNELPEIMNGYPHDNLGATSPRRALKGAFNVSGRTVEVEGTEQRPLGVTETSIIPIEENDFEVHTPRRTPSGQSVTCETPSDISVDNDDEKDETYTPGKPSKARQYVAKRRKMSNDRSKTAKKRRLGEMHSSGLHFARGTSPITRSLHVGPDNGDTSLAGASGEYGDQEHFLPSPAHTHLEASGRNLGRSTADLKIMGQEFSCDLATAPSTQTIEGEGMRGDGCVHMEITRAAEDLDNCYEDGGHGNPIYVHEESPPPIANRPLYSGFTAWESNKVVPIETIGGIAGNIEQPLALSNQGDSAKIKDEQNGLPYFSMDMMDMMGQGSDPVARSIAVPRSTPEVDRVLQFPLLPYCHAKGQSGRGGYTPYNSSRRDVSTGRPQDLDWKRDAAAWSLPPAMAPQDTERASNVGSISCSKPIADGVASSDQDGLTQNREERARSPDTSIHKGHERDEKVSRNLTEQSILPLSNTTYSMISSPSRLPPQAKPKIREDWFVVVNKPTGGQRKYRPSDLHMHDMTLASSFNLAATTVPTGIEIRNISLTIGTYQYDKNFPEFTETVEKDDEDAFEQVKLEFMDSIREYVEKGVTRYKFLLEVNPNGK